MKKILCAIEMFAGIGGFRIGLEAAGIKSIWANDLNPSACGVYERNFGQGSIIKGDIREIDIATIPKHDVLTAGFPCQSFSSAGKKQGVRDETRGTLFEQIVRVLAQHKPKYFILENVKRLLTMEHGHHFRIILDALASLDYFIEWRIVNCLQFGIPQNRDRIYIIGRCTDGSPLADGLTTTAGLLTENDVAHLGMLAHVPLRSIMAPIRGITEKNACYGVAYKGNMFTSELPSLPNIEPPNLLRALLEDSPSSQFDFTDDTLNRIVSSTKKRSYVNGVEILYNQGGGARMGYTVFGINGVVPTLTASTSRHYERYEIDGRFRRLTNVEYARLMGFPDDWCAATTPYNQYALYGNAVIPACVQWVASRLGKSELVCTSVINDREFALWD